jgi:hypothetical protein
MRGARAGCSGRRRSVGKEHEPVPLRRARQVIQYYVVVDGTPSPEMLLENYIWCLKQREMAGDGGNVGVARE